jgi:ribosomal protein L36
MVHVNLFLITLNLLKEMDGVFMQPNLRYPINIQRGQDFPVVIEGLNERTVKRKGYVYMINNHNGSFKRGQGNIELIKPCKDKKDAVPFISKLEVLLSDFRVRHDIIKK